jgi:hypothetical protein
VLGELDVVEDVDGVELVFEGVDEGHVDDLIEVAKVDELFELATCPLH